MCFSGCPYERKDGHPDFRGECTIGRIIPDDAHCYDAEESILSEREVEDEREAERVWGTRRRNNGTD